MGVVAALPAALRPEQSSTARAVLGLAQGTEPCLALPAAGWGPAQGLEGLKYSETHKGWRHGIHLSTEMLSTDAKGPLSASDTTNAL